MDNFTYIEIFKYSLSEFRMMLKVIMHRNYVNIKIKNTILMLFIGNGIT